MKKNIGIIIPFIALFLTIGCYNDKGNYTYKDPGEVLPVTVEGLADTTCVVLLPLNLTPEIKGRSAKEDYEYTWIIYPDRSLQVDTISRDDRVADYPVNLNLGTYTLRFFITDKQTGVSLITEVKIQVVSDYYDGWLVLKDKDNVTDLDFVTLAGELRENCLSVANGTGLTGQALMLDYQFGEYGHEWTNLDGELENNAFLKALLILSTEDMGDYNPSTLEQYKDRNGIFYDAPSVIRPQNAGYAFDSKFLINNGKIYIKDLNSYDPVGKYAYEAEYDYDYDLHSGLITTMGTGALVFDMNKRSFLYSNGYLSTTRIFGMTADEDPYPQSTEMEYDLVHMLPRDYPWYPSTGYALMKHIETGDYVIFGLSLGGNYTTSIFTGMYDVSATSPLLSATVLSAHRYSGFIYYTLGDNQLRTHMVTELTEEELGYPRDEVMYEFPAGEVITSIKHNHATLMSGIFYDDCFSVTTTDGNSWKLYVFDFKGSTAEIEEGSMVVYSGGEGTARYVYRM